MALAAGLGLLSMLGLLAWVFSGGNPASPAPGNSGAPGMLSVAAYRSASASPSAKAGKTVPGLAMPLRWPSGTERAGRCPASAVVLSVFIGRPDYSGRQDPQFEVDAVSTASGTCTFDLGPGRLHLTMMSAGRVIWGLADCARNDAAWVALLTRGVPAKESIIWNRSISFPGCIKVASSARSGTYEVQARTAATASQVRTFRLR